MNVREGFVRRIAARRVLGTLAVAALAVFIGMCCAVAAGPHAALAAEAPREIDGLRVTQIELGADCSAAITEDGTLWMWGDNSSGKLGDGTTENRLDPVKILDDVESVSLGGDHSAAVKKDGTLWVWGDNGNYQLGDGTREDSLRPKKLMDNVRSVSLGEKHSAAITDDGVLWLWGSNYQGAVGTGKLNIFQYTPVEIMDNVASVSLGANFSAAIDEDGVLWTWGDNAKGQLGTGSVEASSFTPVTVMENVRSVSLGNSHAAAITEDGTLWTWGCNDSGQLGDGTTENRNKPTEIMGGVKSVSLSSSNTAAISEDDVLYSCGAYAFCMLGDGSLENRSELQEVADGVAAVSLGSYHAAYLDENGAVYAWGGNRLTSTPAPGDGTSEYRTTPTLVIGSAQPEPEPEPDPEPDPVPSTRDMYRLYNRWTGEHFYTASAEERDGLIAVGWTDEGLGWVAPTSGDPVYRLYNPYVTGGDHHYTLSWDEVETLREAGWEYEGVGWYSAPADTGVPLYRQYNPYATTGTHNYTTSEEERDHLVSVGWRDEGIAWYGAGNSSVDPAPDPVPDPDPEPDPAPDPDFNLSHGSYEVVMEVGSTYPLAVHGDVQQTGYTSGLIDLENVRYIDNGEGDNLYLVTALRAGTGYLKFNNHDDDKVLEVSIRVVPVGSGERLTEPDLWAANADYVLRWVNEGYAESLVLSNEIASASSSNAAVFEVSADGREVSVDPVGIGAAELSVTDVYGNSLILTIKVDRVI